MSDFQFESLSALLWMDGHGPYVWAAYGITLAGLVFVAVSPRLRRARILKESAAAARRASKRPADATTEQEG